MNTATGAEMLLIRFHRFKIGRKKKHVKGAADGGT